jgi:hypothetical protein
MITVKVVYLDGTEDIKDVLNTGDICLDGVDYVKVIREKE